MRARRLTRIVVLALTAILTTAPAAAACGGLVGENGTISLVRTTTLAAFHDGVERYVTSFEFSGQGVEVGSIVPLPGIPTKVERGGDWTLQRLREEVTPPPSGGDGADAAFSVASDSARVVLETKVDALDITVLEGGGDAVGRWATEHGFFLTPDAPEVLDFYARRSPIFMAARFDASRAEELGQDSGDGTPIMLTIPTQEPWVPLRILGLGLDGSERVEADVFVLTDEKPKLLAGGRGLGLSTSERASASLLEDLRSDKGMEWVPPSMWLSHLELDTEAYQLDYDLAVSTRDGVRPAIEDTGVGPDEARAVTKTNRWWIFWTVVATLVAIGIANELAPRMRRGAVEAA